MSRSSRPFWLGEDKRKWDHVRIHKQLFEDPRLGAYEQAIYSGIAVHADVGDGEANPSAETLAGYANCSERNVRNVLQRLKQWGYIEIVNRQGQASIYRLMPPPALPPSAASDAGVAKIESDESPERGAALEVSSAEQGAEVSAAPDAAVAEGAATGSGPPRNVVPTGPERGADELDRTIELDPEGGDERPRITAADIMQKVIPVGDDRLPRRFKGHLATRIQKLLGEGKFDPAVIEQAARRCIDHQRPDPALMDSLVVEILNEKNGRGANGRGPFQAPDVKAYEGAIR